MPTPNEGESQSDFIHRCVPIVMNEGTTDDNKQAVAICGSMWRRAHAKKSLLASLLGLFKDATAQSVHSTTALGNQDKSNKLQDFNEVLAEMTRWDAARLPDVSLPSKEGADMVHGDMEGISTAYLQGEEEEPDEPDEDDDDPKTKSWKIPFEIKKSDPEQRLIFGWASVVEKDGQAVIDHQDDIIPIVELEKAAYDFVLYSRVHGDLHERVGVGRMVESMVFTPDKQKALGIDLKQVGWWVGFKVDDDELWAAHKRGERPDFSIGGSCVAYEPA